MVAGKRKPNCGALPGGSWNREMRLYEIFKLFNRHLVVPPLPATGVPPEERENDLAAYRESFCWQIDVLQVPAALFGAAVLGALPAIETPVHHGRFHQQKAQLLSAG